MNKRKFLEELEKQLVILEETEKQDILNEYKDIINEKVKHGKTEEEAITDFGSIDELTKEILSAYKINPNYTKGKQTNSEKAKEIIHNSEDIIKAGARKLSEFTRNLVDDIKTSQNPITIEMIFEIIIKAILLLIGFVILRIPFWIIKNLGVGILEMTFVPFDRVLMLIWSGIVGVLYFVTCVIIAILVFKQYFKTDYNATKKRNKSVKKRDNIQDIKKTDDSIQQEENIKKSKESSLTSTMMIIVKIFVIFFFLIPLFSINLGLISALVCGIFLLYKGLNVIGLIAMLIGLIIIFGYFSSVMTKLLYKRTKFYLFPFVIGIILLVTGGLLVMDKVIDIEYYNILPPNSFEQKTIVYQEKINETTYIYGDNDPEMVIDNTLENGEINIEVIYYRDLVDIEKSIFLGKNDCTIYINANYNGKNKKQLLNIIIEKLKKKQVFNYGYFFKPEIKIFANENTINLIH